jgi:uncharacterized protein YdaU (DUF1376 family)
MTTRPWMPLYIADYLADTAHLGALQSGAYLHLIMHYWQNGGLPEGDAALARIARLSPAEFRRERATLAAFFHEGWKHKRIDAELAHAADVSSKRRASAEHRHGKRDANASANAEQLDTHARGLSQPQPQEQTSLRSERARELSGREIALERHGEAAVIEDEFDRAFWPAYPHKVGKPAALKAFRAARKRAELARILDGLEAYIRDKPPDRSWLNPATFLNQDRFDDQPASAPNGHGSARVERPHETFRGAVARVVAKRAGLGERTTGADDGSGAQPRPALPSGSVADELEIPGFLRRQ